MKEYIENLLKGVDIWRLEMFINKLNELQKDATINEVGEFAMTAKAYAKQIHAQRILDKEK